ncbi:MAG: DUF1476 domain-containing protein [Alphaproteobacteria bacterium]
MGQMDDRQKGFEKKYAMDEETRFRIEARTSKLFGLWAAEKMGISGDEAATYAGEVVSSNLEEAGFEDILRKVSGDFAAKNVNIPDTELRAEIDRAHREARRQVAPDSA